jgi:hypothetical protein
MDTAQLGHRAFSLHIVFIHQSHLVDTVFTDLLHGLLLLELSLSDVGLKHDARVPLKLFFEVLLGFFQYRDHDLLVIDGFLQYLSLIDNLAVLFFHRLNAFLVHIGLRHQIFNFRLHKGALL